MNRLTRITSILIHLQSKRIVTAREMADRFEVSLRTIYRDVKLLQESGIPIAFEYGVGYFIVEGYNLPPVMITEEEANALIVSEKLIMNQGDLSLKKEFNSFLIKIKSILKNYGKDSISKLENRIIASKVKEAFISNSLSAIQKAITSTNVLVITYHSLYKDEHTKREVEPLGLYYTENAWIVIAYCRLRHELREFRLDRILQCNISNSTFEYSESFSLSQYFTNLTNAYLNQHNNKKNPS